MRVTALRSVLSFTIVLCAASLASAQLQPSQGYPAPAQPAQAAQPAPAPTPAPAQPQQPQAQPQAQPQPQPQPSYGYQPAPAPAPPPQPAPAPAEPEPEPEPAPAADTGGGDDQCGDEDNNWGSKSDHDCVLDHVAFGWMGVMGVPIGNPTSADETVDAPVIGMRFWMSESMGLDIGLGIGFESSGSTDIASNTDSGVQGGFGLMLHGGLPISLWDAGHYNALIIPVLDVGFASGIIENGATSADDDLLSGFLVNLGLRAGTEIHLDFLDIPQATAQITFGVGLAFEMRTAKRETPSGDVGTDTGSFRLGTDVGAVSDLLASGINIFFYL